MILKNIMLDPLLQKKLIAIKLDVLNLVIIMDTFYVQLVMDLY